MTQVMLPDTSLCAIVRDEIINTAGGIVKFVEHSVPHVEEAVIVDTGSKDGTREVLEELASRYSNLRVLDRPFDNYSFSRNFSLKSARTKYALVLDADERLSATDFNRLREIIINQKGKETFSFDVLEIHPNKAEFIRCHRFQRLLNIGDHDIAYDEPVFEVVAVDGSVFINSPYHSPYKTDLAIKHFVPSDDARERKEAEWYDYLRDNLRYGRASMKGPKDMQSFKKWKDCSPQSEIIYLKLKDLSTAELARINQRVGVGV